MVLQKMIASSGYSLENMLKIAVDCAAGEHSRWNGSAPEGALRFTRALPLYPDETQRVYKAAASRSNHHSLNSSFLVKTFYDARVSAQDQFATFCFLSVKKVFFSRAHVLHVRMFENY